MSSNFPWYAKYASLMLLSALLATHDVEEVKNTPLFWVFIPCSRLWVLNLNPFTLKAVNLLACGVEPRAKYFRSSGTELEMSGLSI